MKPIIKIFVSNKPNEITLTSKELQELIDTAYNEGYKEGKKMSSFNSPSQPPNWWETPTVQFRNGDSITTDHTNFKTELINSKDYSKTTSDIQSEVALYKAFDEDYHPYTNY